MNSNIRLDHLFSLMENRKLSQKDKSFIYNHLTAENRDKLSGLRKEKKLKPYVENDKAHRILPKLTFAIIDNRMMASEMITALSRSYKHTSFAILEADRLNPTLASYLNVSPYVKSVYNELDMTHQTGLNLLIDGIRKNRMNKSYLNHIAIKVDGYKNVAFFSGSYLIEDYEYYRLEDFIAVVDLLEKEYDVLFICVNKFIYDAYTCYAMLKSHINLIGINARQQSITEMNKYLKFLSLKQNIKMNKNYFIMFDYQKSQMAEELIKMKLDGYYLGNIPYDKLRHKNQRKYALTHYKNKTYLNLYSKKFKKIIKRLEL